MRTLQRWRGQVHGLPRGLDLAVLHTLAVLGVFLVLHTQSPAEGARFVQESSTNLANLRRSPARVLVLSAVVVPHPAGLLVLLPLVAGLVAVQRWLGRVATVVAFGFGHVGASLVVATVLAAGLTHGRLDPSVARAPDVGVSYGLACLLGLLGARVPRWARVPWVVLPSAGLALVLVLAPDFTALGHLVALLIGFGLAVLVHRGAGPPARPPAAAAQLP
ncbi:rhomboid-like protein [Kineococcus sp. LSe6-4]|uniref:Rhomboid-like protein n=1 Tax=Kineococcus halophytocola TaxID=3234027 RepID=A0ABV4H0J2_9ACTN